MIQIFDSWAGALSVTDFREYCLPWTKELVERVKAFGVPVIYFGVDTASLLSTMRETGADVIGLDWRVPLEVGWKSVGEGCGVSGKSRSDYLVCATGCAGSGGCVRFWMRRRDGLGISSTWGTASYRERR